MSKRVLGQGQRPPFDIGTLNPNAKECLRQIFKQCYAINKNKEKHHCNQRIMGTDQKSVPFLLLIAMAVWQMNARYFIQTSVVIIN